MAEFTIKVIDFAIQLSLTVDHEQNDMDVYFKVERRKFQEDSHNHIDLSRYIQNQEHQQAEYHPRQSNAAKNGQHEEFWSSSSAFSKIQSELLPYEPSLDNKDTIIMQKIEDMPKLSYSLKDQIQNSI